MKSHLKIHHLAMLLLPALLFLCSCQGPGNKNTPMSGVEAADRENSDEKPSAPGRANTSNSEKNPGKDDVSLYYPHRAGDEWTYWITVQRGESVGGGEITARITREENVNGVKCTVMESFRGDKLLTGNYYRVTNYEVIMYRQVHLGEKPVDFDPPSVILKSSPQKGQKWINPSKLNGFDTKFTVLGEEKIETPAGKFRAWKIESRTDYSRTEYVQSLNWYAPGVGLVKQVETIHMDDYKSKTTLELKGYRINVDTSSKKTPTP